jgi:short-subunit dehydrogenase
MTYTSVLITGASSGIGKALCHLIAPHTKKLIVTGRRLEALESLAKELHPKTQVEIITADLALPAERTRIIEAIQKNCPSLIINNAGFTLYGDALQYPLTDQLKIFEVNAAAVLDYTLKAAHTLITQKKTGTILNVASAAAFYLFPSMSVYAASKAFVVQLSRSLDFELAPYGIRVLVACPGKVDTEFSLRASGIAKAKKNCLTMTPEFAAQEIWKQIQNKKPFRIFDWKYRIILFLTHFIPKNFLAVYLRNTLQERIQRI